MEKQKISLVMEKNKELTRVLPATDSTTLRDKLTYEKLIIFDRKKEVVQEEMRALVKATSRAEIRAAARL